MFRKYTVLCLVLLASVMIVARPASARTFADIYVECGLGALLAPNTPVVAVITNITWDLGTTAILSNISSPESCKGGEAETAEFIYDSYDLLEVDLASGEGDYLDMLAVLVEYESGSELRDEFLTSLRADFVEYVAQSDYTSQSHYLKAEALYNMVYKHASH